MLNPKISVIVPIYNAEKFLKKCIESIINQTLKEIEIILINDGSTDNSLKILQFFKEKDERIIIVNKKNEGASEARNVGIDLAKGEYITFLDSDDYIEKNMLEKMYYNSKKNNVDILISDYYRDENKEKRYKNSYYLGDDLKLTSKKCCLEILSYKIAPMLWSKLIKRQLFIDNNIRLPKEVFHQEDYITMIKLSYYAKKIMFLKEAFYNYVIHENQGTKTSGKEKEFFDYYNSYIILEKFFSDKKDGKIFLEKIYAEKIQHYYNYLKRKYKNTNIHKKLFEELKKEKFQILKSDCYLEWSFIKRMKFRYRLFFMNLSFLLTKKEKQLKEI